FNWEKRRNGGLAQVQAKFLI
ncbi:hypothetical protein AZ006_002385, partial [Citrobacter freundii]